MREKSWEASAAGPESCRVNGFRWLMTYIGIVWHRHIHKWCIYIYIIVHKYIYIYNYIHTCIHTYCTYVIIPMCITQIYIYTYIYIHHISSMCLLCLPCVYVCVYIYIYVCVRVYVQRKARFLFYCTLLFFWSLEFIQLAVRSAQYWQDQPA